MGVIGGEEREGRVIMMRLGLSQTSIYRIYVCILFFLFEMGGNERDSPGSIILSTILTEEVDHEHQHAIYCTMYLSRSRAAKNEPYLV